MILQVFSVQVNSIKITIHWLTHSDSTYRQKIQKINDEKYMVQNEIAPQAEVSRPDSYPMAPNHGT